MKEIFDTFIRDGKMNLFGKLAENWIYFTILLVGLALVIVGLIMALIEKKRSGLLSVKTDKAAINVKTLVTGAMCVGLAFVLSFIRIWRMPLGGSITPASCLPIILFAYIYGWKAGFMASFAYSLLQFLQSMGDAVSFPQVMLDYIVAYTLLGVAAFFKFKGSIVPAVIAAYTCRYFSAVLAAYFFWMQYNETRFSGVAYCFLYNAVYIVPEMIICVILVVIPPVSKLILKLRNDHMKELAKDKTAAKAKA